MPKKYIEEVGWDAFKKAPVGVGPYKFVSYTPGQSLVLQANEDYWNGAPSVKEAEFRFIPELSTRLAAFLAGELDIVQDVTVSAVELVEEMPGISIREIPSARINYVALVNFEGQTESPMSDQRVRQALNYAVNVPLLIESIMRGHATQLATVMPPSCPCFIPELEPYGYDPDYARTLLLDAGYEPSDLEFTLDSPLGRYPNDKQVCEAIAAQLNDFGMKVQVRVNEWGAQADKIVNRRTEEMFYLGWGSAYEPERVISMVLTSNAPYSGFGVASVDAQVANLQSTVDPQARAVGYDLLQRELYELAPWIFLWVQHDIWGTSDRIEWEPRSDQRIRFDTIQAK